MLNIQTRISLSKESKRRIKKFWKGILGNVSERSWTSINKKVKSEISKKLLLNQKYRCAYCERYLVGLGPEIDHFAPKSENPRFSFNPVNLFYACHICNSSSRKGRKNTITVHNDQYHQCQFAIIHPYFENADLEIIYKDIDRVYFDWNNCTQLGKDTIIFFGFDDLEMTNIRSRQLVFERLNPLTPADEMALIQNAISYR